MNEVEKVAAAIRRHHVTRTLYTGPGKTKARRLHSGDLEAAQAAIAALDAARGDPVAQVVEWLRNGGGTDISQLSGSTQMLFLKGMNRYADAIERGEPFNG